MSEPITEAEFERWHGVYVIAEFAKALNVALGKLRADVLEAVNASKMEPFGEAVILTLRTTEEQFEDFEGEVLSAFTGRGLITSAVGFTSQHPRAVVVFWRPPRIRKSRAKQTSPSDAETETATDETTSTAESDPEV